MLKLHSCCTALILALGCSATAHAYKNCDRSLGEWSAWESSYLVGELQFRADTGAAMGTVTHYNYSKRGPGEIRECHVTYEFSGIYEPVSSLFLLDANRTNLSQACPRAFVASRYPAYVSHTLQLQGEGPVGVDLLRADNGDVFASGSLQDGAMVYRTEERCVPR